MNRRMMRKWLIAASVPLLTAACQPELGACDVEAAQGPIYYDENGFPAYPGQALVEVSCGAGTFCHAQGIPAEDRFGAPAGLDLDVGLVVAPEGDTGGEDLERLRYARRVAFDLRHAIYAHVEAGTMPPTGEAGDTALAAAPHYRASPGTPDERALPPVDSDEGREILRNWLACGAQVIERTEGESGGVGDVVPRASVCPAGQASCGGGCIDVTRDPANCGGCGVACGDGQQCVEGACACLNGLDACGPACVDLETDGANCGACGNGCGDRFCAGATCVDSCPAGTTDCGGSCADLSSNLANCGGCGNACGAGESCTGGACSCASGFDVCDGACVDLATDPVHCGACGNTCSGGAECVSGACACGGGTTDCGGACVDTSSSTLHCGGCGNECAAGEGCVGGSCVGCGPVVSFSTDVEPIFVSSCTGGMCHGGARPSASLSLEDGRVYGELVDVAASCGGHTLVVPGSVDESYLINKLTGTDMCNGSQMPKRGESLPAAELDAIRSWICRGAAND